MKLTWILAAVVLSCPAFADEKGGKGGDAHGPCKADFEAFCKDVEPGEGRIVKCMMAHEAELSEGCKKHLEAKKGMHKGGKGGDGPMDACAQQAKEICKGVEPGEGRIVECMKANADKFTGECKAKLARLQHAKDACGDDLEKFCKGVQPGEGRLIECLKAHRDELSPGCKAVKEGHGGGKHDGKHEGKHEGKHDGDADDKGEHKGHDKQ